jgi:predicted DCC family thiol-disulfide oxidoreductase YuxK
MAGSLQPRGDPSGPVLFFDGECGLCNRLVRTLLRWDRRGALHFAPLQGPSAQAYLRRHGLPTEDFDSLIFVPAWSRRDRPEFLVRTDGALAALEACGRFVRTARLLRRVPSRARDAGYRVIARLRYRIFGEWRPRPLENPDWRQRFLDGGE